MELYKFLKYKIKGTLKKKIKVLISLAFQFIYLNERKEKMLDIKKEISEQIAKTIENVESKEIYTYIEVPNSYRASQYDHTVDDYIKKKLSDRMHKLQDGTEVQRDWYSSFLLYCYNYKTQDIDKDKCITEFDDCYKKEKALITWIKAHKIKVLNSGIKIA